MDLTFSTAEGKFNFRVGAIIIKDNEVLVVKNRESTYFYSVGGRVKYNESCEEAIRREVKEELGIDMEIQRGAFFHEQFFDEEDSKVHYHEIAMYYLMKVPENIKEIMNSSLEENDIKEDLVWLPLDKINNYKIYPRFFLTELSNLGTSLKNIVDIQNR